MGISSAAMEKPRKHLLPGTCSSQINGLLNGSCIGDLSVMLVEVHVALREWNRDSVLVEGDLALF
jgi:hypothetical protein